MALYWGMRKLVDTLGLLIVVDVFIYLDAVLAGMRRTNG